MTIDTAKERERLAALEGHTSGPWGADWASAEDRICVTDAQRWKAGKVDVARIEAGFDEPFESEQRANARLIAAAPDLKRDYLTALDVIDAQAAEIERLREALNEASRIAESICSRAYSRRQVLMPSTVANAIRKSARTAIAESERRMQHA